MKVYIPQAVAKEGTAFLKEKGYEIKEGQGYTEEDMIRDVAGCDAMLIRTAQCPASVIQAGKDLKIIARHGVGFDNIDIQAAADHEIWVTNTPTALADSVAEFTLTAVLTTAKNMVNCSKAMYDGDYFYKNSHKGLDLMGKTYGVVGFGRIGRAVAKKACCGLDMKILAYDPYAKPESVPEYVKLVSWEELFAQSDVISLHLPGGAANKGIVGTAEFELMKKTAILINVARGEVVDQAAAVAALKEGKIRAALLDVQEQEPPLPENPLFELDNVQLTPHMASNTEECMGRMALYAAWQIDKVLSGQQPDWPVNAVK